VTDPSPILDVLQSPALASVLSALASAISTYIATAIRATKEELRREMAELENRIIARINGTYVRREEWQIDREAVREKFQSLSAGAGGK
jgi:BMFP domain-containing protein YqiC